jgi:hypothetical protein
MESEPVALKSHGSGCGRVRISAFRLRIDAAGFPAHIPRMAETNDAAAKTQHPLAVTRTELVWER